MLRHQPTTKDHPYTHWPRNVLGLPLSTCSFRANDTGRGLETVSESCVIRIGDMEKNPTAAESIEKVHMVHGLVGRKCYISNYRGTSSFQDMWVGCSYLGTTGDGSRNRPEQWLLRVMSPRPLDTDLGQQFTSRELLVNHDIRYKGQKLQHMPAVQPAGTRLQSGSTTRSLFNTALC